MCSRFKTLEGVERSLFFTKSILRTIKTIKKMSDLDKLEAFIISCHFVNETKDGRNALRGILNGIASMKKSKNKTVRLVSSQPEEQESKASNNID